MLLKAITIFIGFGFFLSNSEGFFSFNKPGVNKENNFNQTDCNYLGYKQSIKTLKTEKIVDIKLKRRTDLLIQPFNVYEFKKKVQGSNSGGASVNPIWFKPAYKGFYYRFFMFDGLKAYKGRNKHDTIKSKFDLSIFTYKPYGKYETEFIDPHEEIIEVELDRNFYDLPELAFIEFHKKEIIDFIGKPDYEKSDCFIYQFKNSLLLFQFQLDRVNWIKYIRLKSNKISSEQWKELCSRNINVW